MALPIFAPVSAWAHAGERAVALLLPTGYAIFGGTVVVAATFLILPFVPGSLVHRLTSARVRMGILRYSPEAALSAVSFALLALLVAAGFFGTRDPLENPLPLTVWTLWWGGLPVAHALFGNLWALLNPWIAPCRLLRRLVGGSDPPLAYPRWLGRWPAVLTFFAFAWFELVDPAPDDPTRLAQAVVIYTTVTVAGILLFGERIWLLQGEAFAVFFRFVAMLSPVQVGPDGRLALCLPGAALARTDPLSLSTMLFVLLTLATVSFDGLSRTFWWLGLGGINPLEFPGRTAVLGRNSFGLALTWAVLASAYALTIALGRRISAAHQLPLFGALVLTILPISVAYHTAHYLPAFLVNAQYALYAWSDPFARRWDLLHLGDPQVTVSFLTDYHAVTILWSIQAGVIVLGHVLAVLIAHAIAVERFGSGRKTMVSQLPLAVLMIGYTTFGLWLLSTPTAG